MKSALRGKTTLDVEVANVTPTGIWLLLDGRELFVAYDQFPWFQDASIREITFVERPSARHLYWPALDVDLAIESLEHPERFPLMARVQPRRRAPSRSKTTRHRLRR